MNRWWRIAGPCAVLLLLAACGPRQQVKPVVATAPMPEDFIGLVKYADADTVRAWQADGVPFLVLDVRTDTEFREEGHAAGAVLHSYYLASRRRNKNVDFLDDVEREFDRNQKILVMCSHGMRATQAAWELGEKKAFTEVYVFPGGYEGHHMDGYGSGDGWKAAGLPVVFPSSESSGN